MRAIAISVTIAAFVIGACGDGRLDDSGIVNDCKPEHDAPARMEGDTFTTEGGVEVVVAQGSFEANPAQAGDEVTVHYVGAVAGGEPFADTRAQDAPFTFTIDTEHAICGWVEGVVGMSPGEVRELTIPPELAYGDAGFGGIVPPGATIIFGIEMLNFGRPNATEEPTP